MHVVLQLLPPGGANSPVPAAHNAVSRTTRRDTIQVHRWVSYPRLASVQYWPPTGTSGSIYCLLLIKEPPEEGISMPTNDLHYRHSLSSLCGSSLPVEIDTKELSWVNKRNMRIDKESERKQTGAACVIHSDIHASQLADSFQFPGPVHITF